MQHWRILRYGLYCAAIPLKRKKLLPFSIKKGKRKNCTFSKIITLYCTVLLMVSVLICYHLHPPPPAFWAPIYYCYLLEHYGVLFALSAFTSAGPRR
jgi:hypothetical protein